MKIKILLVLLILITQIIVVRPLRAETIEIDQKLIDTILEQPDAAIQKISPNLIKENFISNEIRRVIPRNEKELVISGHKFDLKRAEEFSGKKSRNIKKILRYDLALNNEVVIDEAEKIIIADITDKLKRRGSVDEKSVNWEVSGEVNWFIERDISGNGVLSLEEAITLTKEEKDDIDDFLYSMFGQHAGYDLNNDGKVIHTEITEKASKVFNLFDLNNDGVVDIDEYRAIFNSIAIEKEGREFREECGVPTPTSDAEVILYGTYKSDTLSNVVVGQDSKTTYNVDFTIKQGRDYPIYLLLTSYEPIIWNINGDVDNIEHVVVANHSTDEKQVSASGIVGILSEKVNFIATRCLPSFHDYKDAEGSEAKKNVKKLLQKSPDIVFGDYISGEVLLHETDITNTKTKKIAFDEPLPNKNEFGYDERIWFDFLQAHPGGLKEIDPDSVIATKEVKLYNILPQQLGLAQLVKNGSLLPIKDDIVSKVVRKKDGDITGLKRAVPAITRYKIVKDIPRFPADLAESYLGHFILADGVQMPKGSPGHSCVFDEITKKSLSNKPFGLPDGCDYKN